MRDAVLAVPLAILLIAGGCKEAPQPEHAKAEPCRGVPEMLLQGRVTDRADILTPEQETQLSDRLAKYQERTKHEMVVATTPGLYGVDVGIVGTCLGNSWKIGREGHDDGIIILVAPKERKMRIATGRGLEKMLDDGEAQVVVDQMTPHFQRGDYVGGLSFGIDAIAAQTGATS